MKERNSRVELLRIISILMIIMSHYSIHSGIITSNLPLGFNRLLLESISLGSIGVIIFVLINGYYSIKKENPFSLKKLLNLYLQIWFYSFSIYIVFIILGFEKFNVKMLIMNILPFSFKTYWFASVFILLYIFSPFINKFINSMNKKEHARFIVLSLLIFSVLKTLTFQEMYCNELIQFILFYCIGSYIGKYEKEIKINKNQTILILISTLMLAFLSIFILDVIGMNYKLFSEHSRYFLSRTSFLSIIIAVSIFYLFLKKNPFFNIYINKISTCVFAIYLISDNSYVRSILWTDILNVQSYSSSFFILFHLLFSIIIIFFVCIMIEFFRQLFFNKLNNYLIELLYKLINVFKKKKIYIEE